MTRPDDRDPALDAAWRAYSVETPPPALDAKILAAAHREARSRPRAVGDDDDTLAEAREPSRWWWGLAAAATIGAVAFGIVQLAPPLAPQEATTASDMPASAPRREAAPPESQQAPEAPAERQLPVPQPFPAAPSASSPSPKQEVQRKQALTPERKDRADVTGSSGVVVAPPTVAPSPKADVAAPPAPAAMSAPAAPPAAAEPARAAAESTERSAVIAPPPDARSRAGAAADARVAAAPASSAMADEHVRRIERALAEGRTEDAIRELDAFRAAFADADERLPAPLRAWAASVPRKR